MIGGEVAFRKSCRVGSWGAKSGASALPMVNSTSIAAGKPMLLVPLATRRNKFASLVGSFSFPPVDETDLIFQV